MPEVALLEGLVEGAPGMKRRSPGMREVIRVQERRGYPEVCVAAQYAPRDPQGNRPRMIELCQQAHNSLGNRFKYAFMGASYYEVSTGKRLPNDFRPDGASLKRSEGTMREETMEFPTIEDLDDLGAIEIVPQGMLKSSAIGVGVNIGSRLLSDATRAYSPLPGWLNEIAIGALGLVGGRLLWYRHRTSAEVLTSTMLGSAVYDGLVRPLLADKVGLTLGALDIEERTMGSFSRAEEDALRSLEAVQVEPMEALPSHDEDEAEEVVIGDFNPNRGSVAVFAR